MSSDPCPLPETCSRSIRIEESTVRELRELCHQMSNSVGMVAAHLVVGLEKNRDHHIQVMQSALNLSTRGMEALKKLMWLVGSLEESLSLAPPSTARSGTDTLVKETRK
jgi:hypothetical protein